MQEDRDLKKEIAAGCAADDGVIPGE